MGNRMKHYQFHITH